MFGVRTFSIVHPNFFFLATVFLKSLLENLCHLNVGVCWLYFPFRLRCVCVCVWCLICWDPRIFPLCNIPSIFQFIGVQRGYGNLAIFRKTCFQSGSSADVWELGFQEVSYCSLKRKVLVVKLIMKTISFMLNICFSSGTLEVWFMPGEGLCDQPPGKTMATESHTKFFWQTFYRCCHNSLLGEVSMFCVTSQPHWEKTLKCLHLASPWLHSCIFPLLMLLWIFFCYNKS